MLRDLSGWHLLILAAVFVLLFGARKLPDGARALGRSLRIFKSEVKGLVEDEEPAPAPVPVTPPAALPPTAATPVAAMPAEPASAISQPAGPGTGEPRAGA